MKFIGVLDDMSESVFFVRVLRRKHLYTFDGTPLGRVGGLHVRWQRKSSAAKHKISRLLIRLIKLSSATALSGYVYIGGFLSHRSSFPPKRLPGALVLEIYVRLSRRLTPSVKRVAMNNARKKNKQLLRYCRLAKPSFAATR